MVDSWYSSSCRIDFYVFPIKCFSTWLCFYTLLYFSTLLINWMLLFFSYSILASWQKKKKNSKEKSLPSSYLFCQIQCDSMVYICQSRQLGDITACQKEDRKLHPSLGKLFPKSNQTWYFCTSVFNFSPNYNGDFFPHSLKPCIVLLVMKVLWCSHYYSPYIQYNMQISF